jgi:hypothetical protein
VLNPKQVLVSIFLTRLDQKFHDAFFSPIIAHDYERFSIATSQNSCLLVGQDADYFFLDLSRRLSIGAPTALSEPLKRFDNLIGNLEACDIKNNDIHSEVVSAKRRFSALKTALESFAKDSKDLISEIREKRLSGAHEEAYQLALSASLGRRCAFWESGGQTQVSSMRARPFWGQPSKKSQLTRCQLNGPN